MIRIQVAAPSIDWLALQPQSDRKTVTMIERGVRRVVGTTTEKIAVVEAKGLPALRRTQMLDSDELGNRTAETVVFRAGFRPYSHRDASDAGTLSIRYRGSTVFGERETVDGDVTPLGAKLACPVFDAHSVEMVLRVLPLAEDYVAEVPIYHAGRGAQMLVTAHVIGSEALMVSGRSIDAWNVETIWDGVTQYYWIGIESRHLLRQLSELPKGTQLEFAR